MPVSAPPVHADLVPDDARLLGYARVRTIVGLASVLYGAQGLLSEALHVALAKGWAATPSTMGWTVPTGWSVVLMSARVLAMLAFVFGGTILLAGRRPGVQLLRAAAAAVVLVTLVGTVWSTIEVPQIRQQWSTPAAAVSKAFGFASGLWAPVLLAILTVLPLTGDRRR